MYGVVLSNDSVLTRWIDPCEKRFFFFSFTESLRANINTLRVSTLPKFELSHSLLKISNDNYSYQLSVFQNVNRWQH